METVRRITDKTQRDGITNVKIGESCQVTNVVNWINQTNYHVGRMTVKEARYNYPKVRKN